MSASSRRSAGFTLIEVLAAVLLTGIVITGAVAFQINLSSATTIATDATREGRQALAVLDRVAREIETTYLIVKPEATDPLEHPWLFVAEDRKPGDGADRLKFSSRGLHSRGTDKPVGDLGVVAYVLEDGEDDDFQLLRWSRPGLPEGLDRDFPQPDDEGVFVVATGVQHFGLRFSDDQGGWFPEWDSSTLVDSGELPVSAEISIALVDPDADDTFEAEPTLYRRQVLLPVRPIDLVAQIQGPNSVEGGGGGGIDEDGDGIPDDDAEGSGDSADFEAQQLRLRACMDVNRDAILAAGVGQDAFDLFYNSSEPSLVNEALNTLSSLGISCG